MTHEQVVKARAAGVEAMKAREAYELAKRKADRLEDPNCRPGWCLADNDYFGDTETWSADDRSAYENRFFANSHKLINDDNCHPGTACYYFRSGIDNPMTDDSGKIIGYYTNKD